MAQRTLDALTALIDSIPIWVADLENILRTTSINLDRSQALTALEKQDPVSLNAPETAKTRSLASPSRRSTLKRLSAERSISSKSGLIHTEIQQPVTQLQRKRKVSPEPSDAVSWSSKRRAKSKVVIYYDGDVQRAFETLVNKVTSARHAVGKVKATPASLAPLRSDRSTSEASSLARSASQHMAKRARVHRTLPLVQDSKATPAPIKALDVIDRCLDNGQSLCERAAFQVLRDGECSLEVSSAMDCFEEAKDSAEKEIPGLRMKADEDASRHETLASVSPGRSPHALDSHMGGRASPHVIAVLPLESSLEVDSDTDEDGDSDDFTAHLGPFQTRREGFSLVS